MKALRLTAIALAIAIGTTYAAAQTETADEVMQITLNDGTVMQYNVADVTEMTIVPSAITEVGGHQCIDLGLPSGTLWATCNIGSTQPAEYGDYFAWGETSTREYFDFGSGFNDVEEDALREQGVIDAEGNLNPEYDAATVNWGASWRMPTEAECQELVANCDFEWTSFEGHFGCFLTGPNGNRIFLPASGYRDEYQFENTIYDGYYSTATVTSNPYRSYYLWFDDINFMVPNPYLTRAKGMTIRPVVNNKQIDQ